MTRAEPDFAAALLDPGRPVPGGLTDGQGHPAGRRFDVYRNNVVAGLSDALEVGFPVLRRLLGPAFFRAMAGVFLRAHPPASPLLMQYGDGMPAFLAGFAPVSHLPYLPDVARIELAVRRAYHAADATPVEAAALAALPPDRLAAMRLVPSPGVSVVASDWPVHGIWRANTVDGAPPPGTGPETALITRPAFDPVVDPIDPAQTPLLLALLGGVPLAEAAERNGAGIDPVPLLTLLVTRGAIRALT